MRMCLHEFFHSLQIRVLLILAPATLFDRIGQLDWYRKTLQDWVDGSLKEDRLHVLDIGCATGSLAGYVCNQGHEVVGMDRSRGMIRRARRKWPEISFVIGDAEELPFGDEMFDVVYAASVVNLLSNPDGFAWQMQRVCKSGGRVTVLFPAQGFTQDSLSRCVAGLGAAGFSKAALVAWHRNAPKIGVTEVETLLDAAGFECCESALYLNGMVASVSARKSRQPQDCQG